MLADAFKGHGTFFYSAEHTLRKYDNDPAKLAAAMQEAGMSHGWVRLHSWNKTTNQPKVEPYQPTLKLVTALKDAGIAVAGWGWNQGIAPRTDADVAAEQLRRYGIEHYVADIEHGHSDAHWTQAEIRTFCTRLRGNLSADAQILVSTFGFVGTHEPGLMQAAEPYVNGFAPQVYWFYYPKSWMLGRSDLPAGANYQLGRPAEYVRLCVDMWGHYVSKPLVVTGQAYWGESNTYVRPRGEQKLQDFVSHFEAWDRIAGFNWWHFGHKQISHSNGAMSPEMSSAISAARLDLKSYANI